MRRLFVLLLAGAAACSGGGDSTPVTPPPTPTIATSLSPSAGTAARGSSTTTTVTVARGGGFAGTVTLAADAAPSGVTVTFNPASLTGTATTSVATIAVGSSATAGTANIAINATGSGVAASSAAFALTVPSPTITLAAASATASVTQGTAANVGLTVTRTNGFADAISLAASGMPTGVAATFAPASIAAGATTSTLVLATATTAAPGTYPITITASGSGVANVTTTVSLTITAAATPAFTLSASPAALNVTAGGNGTSTITAVRTGGFAGDVALAVSGAPAGMTTSLSPTSLGANVTTATLVIATTGAIAPGAYTLTMNGTGTGVAAQSTAITVTVAAPAGVTLSAIAAQQLSQGTSSAAAIPIVLTRTGGLAGDLTMALEGAPTGVTATFSPNPATASSTQMTLTASATAAPGTYTLTVRATGAGGATGVTTFPLTVTAAATGSVVINAVPATLSVVQGQTGLSTINIARAGGFTGAVALTASGAPAGTSVTFTPSSATGTQSQVGIAVGASTAAGTYTITVRGQGAGVADATTTLTLTVTASGGGGGTGNVIWTFCDDTEFPFFVAYRNGRTGAWQRASNSGNNTYRFQIDDAGGVAIVKPLSGGTADVTVWYGTSAQLVQFGQQECTASPATKSLTGAFAGLSAQQVGTLSIGGGFAQTTQGGPSTFSVSNVAVGATDLLAFRSAQGFTGGAVVSAPDRGILRRNVNYPANSAIPTLDFNSSEAFTPASAQVTVNNAGSGLLTVFAAFQTNSATFGGFSFGTIFGGTNPYTVYGVPADRTQAGDFHLVQATNTVVQNNSPVESRSATQFNRNLASRALTLGPSLTQATFTSLASAPYARIRARGPWQAEYGDQVFVNFQQQATGATRNWTINLTRAYSGSSGEYEAEIPDFNSVTGWDNTWGLRGGVQLTTSVFAYSYGSTTGFTEGLVALTAGRFGSFTP